MERIRYTYDTEFVDDGKTIELISIGIVCLDDGRQYYAVNRDLKLTRIMRFDVPPYRWLRDHVLPGLPITSWGPHDYQIELDAGNKDVRRKRVIANEVREFLTGDGRDPDDRDQRELWAYFASYDHVALAQLWGMMVDLPPGVPMFTRDIKDWAVRLGDPELPEQSSDTEHNALHDALHNVTKIRHLEHIEQVQRALGVHQSR